MRNRMLDGLDPVTGYPKDSGLLAREIAKVVRRATREVADDEIARKAIAKMEKYLRAARKRVDELL